MSQETLAAKLGITFQQLQKYERGDNRISAGRLFELALALDTTIAYFFEGAREASRVLRGMAEEGAAFAGQEDMQLKELVSAFRAIKDSDTRKRVLALAKTSAAAASQNKPNAPRKRS